MPSRCLSARKKARLGSTAEAASPVVNEQRQRTACEKSRAGVGGDSLAPSACSYRKIAHDQGLLQDDSETISQIDASAYSEPVVHFTHSAETPISTQDPSRTRDIPGIDDRSYGGTVMRVCFGWLLPASSVRPAAVTQQRPSRCLYIACQARSITFAGSTLALHSSSLRTGGHTSRLAIIHFGLSAQAHRSVAGQQHACSHTGTSSQDRRAGRQFHHAGRQRS